MAIPTTITVCGQTNIFSNAKSFTNIVTTRDISPAGETLILLFTADENDPTNNIRNIVSDSVSTWNRANISTEPDRMVEIWYSLNHGQFANGSIITINHGNIDERGTTLYKMDNTIARFVTSNSVTIFNNNRPNNSLPESVDAEAAIFLSWSCAGDLTNPSDWTTDNYQKVTHTLLQTHKIANTSGIVTYNGNSSSGTPESSMVLAAFAPPKITGMLELF